jgi:competence CoiA-like predicted nuclease
MLTALRKVAGNELTKEKSYQIPKKITEQSKFFCPICREKVIYVSKGSNGTISHFRHKNSCSHESIAESKKHSNAKKILYQKVKQDNDFRQLEIEKIIGSRKKDYQIADLYLERDEEKIAIEFQCSIQSKKDFIQRTKFYNKKNIAVIWILDQDKYAYHKASSNSTNKDTIVFKEPVKWIQSKYYGRVYFWCVNRVVPFRMNTIKVENNSEYGPSYQYLDTIASYTTGEIPDYSLTTSDSESFKIARFYDKVWWT